MKDVAVADAVLPEVILLLLGVIVIMTITIATIATEKHTGEINTEAELLKVKMSVTKGVADVTAEAAVLLRAEEVITMIANHAADADAVLQAALLHAEVMEKRIGEINTEAEL
jgi:hypothetical protein